MNNRLAIIVYSCYRNSDMWKIFSTLFRRYWDECPYKIILVTDKDDNDIGKKLFDKVLCIDSTWYNMITKAVLEAKCDYVMLMMDDYLLCGTVDNRIIYKILDDADKYNVLNIRFVGSQIKLDKEVYKQDSKYDIYKPGKAYSITTQAGIWKSNLLLEYMKPEWTAWDFERIGSLVIRDDIHPLLGTRYFNFPYVEGIRKGKWMKQGIEVCRFNNICLDFNRRKKFSLLGNEVLKFKTFLYNINPTLMLRLYNSLCGRKHS